MFGVGLLKDFELLYLMYVCVYMCVCVCVYIYIYIYIYMYVMNHNSKTNPHEATSKMNQHISSWFHLPNTTILRVFFLINLFINLLFIFGCIGSLFLRPLEGGGGGALLYIAVARASHCRGFSCCGARALGTRASVVVAPGL